MKKLIRPILWILFSLYCVVLIHLLLSGRGLITDSTVGEHILSTTNFIPFKTIGRFVRQYMDGYFRQTALRNLWGNFFLLFPMGIFLPCLFPKINRLWKAVLWMFTMIVVAEAAQGLLRIGYIDIDDLIFNLIGGVLGYAMIKIPVINRWLRRSGILR